MGEEMRVETPTPFLNVYRGVFDASEFLGIAEELSSEEWPRLSWDKSTEDSGEGQFVSEYRSSFSMSLVPILQEEVVDELAPAKEAFLEMYRPIDECVWDYRNSYNLYLSLSEPVSVLKYSHGAEYRTHWDSSPMNGRVLSMVCYANDDYEGGELDFPGYGVTVKPEAGMVVLFPSSYTHKHAARPVTSGTKYSLVTWFQ